MILNGTIFGGILKVSQIDDHLEDEPFPHHLLQFSFLLSHCVPADSGQGSKRKTEYIKTLSTSSLLKLIKCRKPFVVELDERISAWPMRQKARYGDYFVAMHHRHCASASVMY